MCHQSFITRHQTFITRHTFYLSRHTFYLARHTFYLSRHTFYLSRHTFYLSRHTFYLSHHTFYLSHHTFYLSHHTFYLSHHTFYLARRATHALQRINAPPPPRKSDEPTPVQAAPHAGKTSPTTNNRPSPAAPHSSPRCIHPRFSKFKTASISLTTPRGHSLAKGSTFAPQNRKGQYKYQSNVYESNSRYPGIE